MGHVSFTKDEKAKLFDEIAECFYEANFGLASKSEIELMMFRFYIEKLVKDNMNEDGTIDYQKCSDYVISKDLGITQQRVRNLKVRNQLVHPIEFDWKAALAKITENARFDRATNKVTLNIPDPNLYIEIQNFIEEQGAYVEKHLNSKILQIRAEYYVELIIKMESAEDKRKKIIKELKRQFNSSEKENIVFDENNIGKSLVDAAVNITEIAKNLSDVFSDTNIIGKAFIHLLENNFNQSN